MSTDTSSSELQPDEIADYEELRTLFAPTAGLQVLDDFAKWLFTITAVVASLGAGFASTGTSSLSGSGRRLFAVAVMLVAVSLTLAVLARMPWGASVNRNSRASMQRTLSTILKVRWSFLIASGVTFAAALALAGLAQLV